MGLFGRKKPENMGYTTPLTPPPGFMSGMGMPQAQPAMPMGGYDQNAAMQGQSGFQGQAMPEKKPGVNWAGIAADFLAGMAGQPGQFAAQQRRIQDDERQFRYAGQLRDQNRQDERADYLWKLQQERANPKPINNDTINDFNWYKNLSDEDKLIYRQMKPEYRQGPDGKFYPVETAQGPLPTFAPDDWNTGQPLGGSVGNGTDGF